jgi:hypothetical protein
VKPGDGQRTRQETLQEMALDEALGELCERKESLLLATPYFTFESRFIERAGPDLRVRATMSRNAVRHVLSQTTLRMLFPWNLTLFGGPTRILEYEEGTSTRTLRLSVPACLAKDDQRRSYRLELVGRSSGTLGSRELHLVKVALENINHLGIGVFCAEPLPPTGFQRGRTVDISLNLEQGPAFQATGRICHGNGQFLGLAFDPPLAGPGLEQLTAWLQPRLTEAQRVWNNRASLRTQAELSSRPKALPEGILLVCADAELQARVGAALGGVPPLRSVVPAMAPFREAMTLQPPQVLLLAVSGGIEETHRLRALLEGVPPQCPVVALGVGPDLELSRALAAELKATLFLDRHTFQTPFFQRLMLGLIRKHFSGRPEVT